MGENGMYGGNVKIIAIIAIYNLSGFISYLKGKSFNH
jgi:hypothetical protein